MDNQNKDTASGAAGVSLIPPSRWLDAQRGEQTPIAWRDDTDMTLGQLRRDVSRLWLTLEGAAGQRWALCTDDGYLLLVGLLALWYRGKTPVLPGHCRSELLREQRAEFDGILSDLPLTPGCPMLRLTPEGPPSNAMDELPPLSDHVVLVLYTSGSTGRPKAVSKTLGVMATEARWLAALAQNLPQDCRLVSSVSLRHLYGLSFALFLPMGLGIPFFRDPVRYPEQLIAQCGAWPVLFVSSPALITRLDPSLPAPRCAGLFSAGGPLPWQQASRAESWLSAPVTEIYGSSETGAVAWRRRRTPEDDWHPFDGVTLDASRSPVRAKSALIEDPAGYPLDDLLTFSGRDGGFQLTGRRDRSVNIEEQRLSLDAIELRLASLDGVGEVAVLALEKNGRHSLGAAIVLSPAGVRLLERESLPERIKQWRRQLAAWLEPVAVPRYWRVIGALPRDTQSKIDRHRLRSLFFRTLPIELSRRLCGDRQADLTLKLEPSLFWFRGHFPRQPILPGVAQVDWVVHYAQDLLAPEGSFAGFESLKFQRPVKPGQMLSLHLEWDSGRHLLLFRYQQYRDGEQPGAIVSSGKISLCP